MIRSTALLLALSSTCSIAAVACSPAASDDSGSQTANATGGTAGDEASFVYVFAPTSAEPVCTGAIIADKAIVVARSCVAEGLEVSLGFRGDDPLFFNKTKVTKSHIPDRGPADIAVLELASKLANVSNMVTRYPLRDGYKVFARQSADEGFFGTPTGWATTLGAALVGATDTQASLLPAKDTKLCTRDLGAMVCSSTEKGDVLDLGPRDRCGLAGIVVAPPDGAVLDANGCSNEAWKIAPLGIYQDFLTQFAPRLFEPIVNEGVLGIGASTFVPDGLWGYDSAGDVASCSVDTAKLDPAKKTEMRTVRGKASFEGMAKHAAAVGEIGIARKSAPNVVWWSSATRGSLVTTPAFDDTFTQDIGASADGEYIVSFRVSANGGETWKRCDDAAKPLALVVGDPPTAPVTKDVVPGPPPATTDAGAPPASDGAKPPIVTPDPPAAPKSTKPKTTEPGESTEDPSDHSDPSTADKIVSSSDRATSDSGCSTTGGAGSGAPGPFAGIGLLVGLAALVRRRR